MKRKILIAISIVYLLVVGCTAFTVTEKEPVAKKPDKINPCKDCNVILISLDTLRADRLGAYGYHRNTSPVIDALAKESIVFHNHFSNAYFTLPSHMSIFTSTYPIRHKINYPRTDLIPENNTLSKDIKTMAEIMQGEGYKTIWSSYKEHAQFGFSRGFERGFDESYYGMFGKEPTLSPSKKGPVFFYDPIFWQMANQSQDKKFFWFVHSTIIHTPYITPEPFNTAFSDSEGNLPKSFEELSILRMEKAQRLFTIDSSAIRERLHLNESMFRQLKWILATKNETALEEFRQEIGPPEFASTLGWDGITYMDTIRSNMTAKNIEELTDSYDEGILFMDSLLGIFFEELKQSGLWNNTIIILTSDHGEELFEHGGFEHSNFYDHTIHVPLIIRVPGLQERIDSEILVQGVDILPSLLYLNNIEVPHSAQGKNAIAILEGSEPPNDYAYGFSRGTRYIRSDRWKYILKKGGTEELYDLATDPMEKTDFALSTDPIIVSHRDELNQQLERWSDEQS